MGSTREGQRVSGTDPLNSKDALLPHAKESDDTARENHHTGSPASDENSGSERDICAEAAARTDRNDEMLVKEKRKEQRQK